ncbi:MAG: ATP-dependent DNA helicase [Candidatus Paceibacterota bacterium]
METFDKLYKKLNTKQKEAVDSIEGPVMVVAGPGTGKTTILTLRIANILRKTDTPPSGILAITFTEAGVKTIKQKLREIMGSRADEIKICTFHGFAGSVISEFNDHFVHLYGFRQMTEIDSDVLIRNILSGEKFNLLRPMGKPDLYLKHILNLIHESKKEALTPEMVRDFAKEEIERIKNDESFISTRGASKGELKADAKKQIEKCEKTIFAADIYEQYEKDKKEKKLMDFDDLIFELLLVLRKDELLLRLLQEKFLYILVDEHQDTNDSQNMIIKLLADFFENPNVFIVGDEKQAIYRFQGASVENFLHFEKIWPGIKTIFLENNYRSHQAILDSSFKMIEKNYESGQYSHLRVRLKASGDKEIRPVDIIEAPDIYTGEEYMISQLKNITENEPNKTVAIITKTNRDVDRIIRICESAGIPVSSERSIDIFSHPVGLIFFSIIEFLHDQSKDYCLAKSIASGLWNIDFESRIEILKDLNKGSSKEVISKIPAISELMSDLVNDDPISFIIGVVEKSGLLEIIIKDPAFVEVWRAILELAEGISKEKNIRDPMELMEKLIAYKISSEEKSIKIGVGTLDLQIKVMTAHGSKGLEFDYCFLPYVTEESWSSRGRNSFFVLPTQKLLSEGDEIRDNRRLFYVALTRAKSHIVLIVPSKDADGKMLSSLRFVSELDEDFVSHTLLPKIKNSLEINTKKNFNQDEKILNYTKRILTEKGLSVTALNHFLDCPSRFIYKSILRLPEPSAPSAEKGNAMHLAFNHVWIEQKRSVERIQEIIEETVREYMSNSLLRKVDKERVLEELMEDAPIVAKSLYEHFTLSGKIFTESWSESEFSADFEDKKVIVPIHGKLDAIVDTGNEVLVFDYKTRGKMSVNQIKGQTQNSDGGYFRQLVFYKMLLESDHRFKGKEITPSLVFISPDEKGRCHTITLPIERSDLADLAKNIQSLIDSVWSGRILTEFCDDEKCEFCKLKSLII